MENSSSTILSAIRNMDPYEFEHLVARLWEEQGYETTVTGGSNDRGIDIIAKRNQPFSERVLIQVKRHGPNSKVSSEDIQKYSGLYQRNEQVDNVVVVSSNEFTNQATNVADARGVKIITGKELLSQVKALDLEEAVRKRNEGTKDAGVNDQNKKVVRKRNEGTKDTGVNDHKYTKSDTDRMMTCPFCKKNLIQSNPEYISHIFDDCVINHLGEVPSNRPKEIPPEIWRHLNDQLEYENIVEEKETNSSNQSNTNENKNRGHLSDHGKKQDIFFKIFATVIIFLLVFLLLLI